MKQQPRNNLFINFHTFLCQQVRDRLFLLFTATRSLLIGLSIKLMKFRFGKTASPKAQEGPRKIRPMRGNFYPMMCRCVMCRMGRLWVRFAEEYYEIIESEIQFLTHHSSAKRFALSAIWQAFPVTSAHFREAVYSSSSPVRTGLGENRVAQEESRWDAIETA